MTHLPASPIIKAIGTAERVPSAYKRGRVAQAKILQRATAAPYPERLVGTPAHPIIGAERCMSHQIAENKRIIRIPCGQTLHQSL